MAELEFSATIADLRIQIDEHIADLFQQYHQNLNSTMNSGMSAATAAFIDLARGAIRGGKRFRGLCAILGAATVLAAHHPQAAAVDLLALAAAQSGLLDLAAALEFYQTSALVHDDFVDRAETRRGEPATRISFAAYHRDRHLIGEADHFGDAAAVLAGDYLLSLADRVLAGATATTPPAMPVSVWLRFTEMTAEVAWGQFLDLHLSQVPPGEQSLAEILAVVKVKSARYSVVHPAVLGALAAGASASEVHFLEAVLENAGIAFQLRDDVLGVFGDPQVTGKPAGDDVREGKRTALLALTWENATESERQILQAAYAATPEQREVQKVIELIDRRGRLPHEQLIADFTRRSQMLSSETSRPQVRELLDYLVVTLTRRHA